MAQTKIQINSLRYDKHFVQTLDVLNLKPQVIYANEMIYSDVESEMRNHQFCELLLVCDGVGKTTIDGVAREIKKGDLVIYNATELHGEVSVETPMTTFTAIIGNLQLQGFEQGCLRDEIDDPIVNTGDCFDKIKEIYNKMIEETTAKKKFFEATVRGLAIELIVEILRLTNYDKISETDDLPYLLAKQYIDENFSKQITLDDICANVYISKFYLSRTFKKNLGLSPIKYIILKRIEKAEKLLCETDYRVKKIATMVGYDDDIHFSKTFKRYNVLSPNAYRAKNKIEKE